MSMDMAKEAVPQEFPDKSRYVASEKIGRERVTKTPKITHKMNSSVQEENGDRDCRMEARWDMPRI